MMKTNKIGKSRCVILLFASAFILSQCTTVEPAYKATIIDKQGTQTQVVSLSYYFKPLSSSILKRIEGEKFEAVPYIVGKIGDSSFSTIPLRAIKSLKVGGDNTWEIHLTEGQVVKFQPEKALFKGKTDIGGDIEITTDGVKQVDFHHSAGAKKCPVDNKILYDETWKYCPYDGKELVKL